MADVDLLPKTKTRARVERPKLFKVIVLNDDFTPVELVMEILRSIFRLDEAKAMEITRTTHQKGLCVVALFSREIAETKAAQAMSVAAEYGFPLKFTTEPEEA